MSVKGTDALGDHPLDKGVAVEAVPPVGVDLFTHVPMPAAAILKPALERNSRWMRDFLVMSRISLAPHGKTTMIPEIFRMQIADGAWGITLSTLQQVRTARRFGIRSDFSGQHPGRPRRNPLDLRRAGKVPGLRFLLPDRLDPRAPRSLCPPIPRGCTIVLSMSWSELGYRGGRTGCRTVDLAMELARAAATEGPAVRLVGVEAFEGLIRAGSPTRPRTEGSATL